jgi:site-specific DNA-methyltransferase (adenine-specific)
MKDNKSSRNQTITLSKEEEISYLNKCVRLSKNIDIKDIINTTIYQDLFKAIQYIPDSSIQLAVIDPPYNLSKDFKTIKFKATDDKLFYEYTKSWVKAIKSKLTKSASIYVCCDWKSTSAIYQALSEEFSVRNRITWQREKGRGSKDNWKNCIEDIWYCTVSSKDFYFNVDAVKQKRKVIAPYREDGIAKDWVEESGEKYRFTHPSNFWDDISIPFWSMPENTEHPTQKPEKLIAKLILASSKPNDIVFDCFLGSGTTSVVAKKLGRNYIGIEVDPYYAAISEKRLEQAESKTSIQGYDNGIFLERNTQNNTKKIPSKIMLQKYDQSLFI